MGHCNSSTHNGGHAGIFGAGAGPSETAAARESERVSPGAIVAARKSWQAWTLLAFVGFYRIFLSPFFGGACKFYPSCSKYAQEAIVRHGAQRGIVLALKRLGRCRPFTKGGFDPVPDAPHAALQRSQGEAQ